MNCKKCGTLLMENDQFCKNCGAAVNEVSAQNNVGSNQNGFNNYQQPVNNNGYNAQPMYNQPVKSNNTKFILIGIGAAILIAIVILIFILGGDSNITSTGSTDNEGSNIGNTTSNYTVKFKGFTFKIPTNLVYEIKSDSILLTDEQGTWSTYIEVLKGSYNQMLTNKNKLQTIYQQQGYTTNPAVEKNIGGLNFITLEVSRSGYNALLGLVKANSMYLFGTTTYNLNNEYDYGTLKTISSILSTAEFNNETNNMNTFEKVDMSGISELAQ